MSFVKRALVIFIAALFVFAFVSCGEKKPVDTFENLIGSAKNVDAEGFKNSVSDNSATEYEALVASANKEALDVLKRLYSRIDCTVLSENVAADEAEGKIVITDTLHQTVRVKIRYPDFDTVMGLTDSERMIFPSSKARTIENLFPNDVIAQYEVERTFDVLLEKIDGEWKIDLGAPQNSDFYGALKFTEFLRWLIK